MESYINDAQSEIRYGVPEECCPICQMKHISDDDAISYILKSKNTNMQKLKEEIKNKFIKTKIS